MNEEEIIEKIRILITQNFRNPAEAFEFYDKNLDGSLSKDELINLLREADVRFFRRQVANQLIDKLDKNGNSRVEWNEIETLISNRE